MELPREIPRPTGVYSPKKTFHVERKVALVSGGTSGIGLAIAHELAGRGCDILLVGLETGVDVLKILEQFESYNDYEGTIQYFDCDFRDSAKVDDLCEKVLECQPGGVDILVNAGGRNHVHEVDGYPDKLWNDMVAMHLTATFKLTKVCLPGMKRKGWGRIINISSQLGVVTEPGKAVYSAVKAGMIGFTKGTALENAKYGITCNAICPTYTRTKLVKGFIEDRIKEGMTENEAKAFYTSRIPTGKLLEPREIADLVVFLCLSAASVGITGTANLIDGGYTIQ